MRFFLRSSTHPVVFLAVLFGLLAGNGKTAQAQVPMTVTRYVSTTGTNTNPASATSWATSTTNLQGAINASASGNQVFVARGTYKPGGNANTDRLVSFAMKADVAIYGGFVGSETAVSGRPVINPVSGQPSSTTLSGEIGNPNSTTDNSLHVFYNETGLTTTAVLDGFVITGGNADMDDLRDGAGGGVYNNGGFNTDGIFCSPTFRNCLFQANSAQAGGAMLNYAQSGTSSPVLINCAFVANHTSRTGGAITNDGSDDGISNPVLTNCLFQNNTTDFLGGAMFSTSEFGGTSSPVLTNCVFLSNSAESGGAMFNEGSSGTSSPVLTNCAFQSNGAALYGGALYNRGVSAGNSSPVLTNCSFLSNTANQGGALYNDGDGGTSSVQLTNSVFWENGGANTFVNNSATLTATYSLFEPLVTGYGSATTNLTTNTSPFASTTGVALAIGSAAINAGNPNSQTVANGPYSATALPTTDLVGNPRILGGRVDMGAIEYQGPFSLSLLTAATPNPVCRGSSVVLSVTASGGSPTYSYTWVAPAGITLSGTSTSAVSATVGNAVTGIQTLTITVADASPTPNVSTSLVSLTVNIPPTPTLTVGPSSTLTCTQTSLTLTATGGGSYAFFGPGVMSQNTVSGTAVVNGPGTYSVVVTGTNSCTARTTLVISQSLSPATRLYVSASQTALNGGDGLSWATAFNDLQSALTYPCSQSLTEIWVAAGVYKPTSTTVRTVSFSMRNNLAIIGGFVGSETAVSGRPAIDPTNGPGGASQPSSSTLSGDIGIVGDAGDNSYHVISNPDGLNNTALLDGFVITGGHATGSGNANRGGAVLNNNSGTRQGCSPTFRNCSFQANYAFYAGGAMYNDGSGNGNNSSPVLTNCLFLANTASSYGGAMYNDGYSGTSSPILTNCTFQANVAGSGGGAMSNEGSFSGTSSPVLTNCLFQTNSAGSSGAMANGGYGGTCNPILINCAFLSNSATSNGGVMYNSGGGSGNCNPVLINCSFQGNRSVPSTVPGVVMANDGSGGTCRVQLTNSVFWDNGGGNTFINFGGASITATYTLFQSSVTGYSSDPTNLPNATVSPFASTTSVALWSGSAAIDRGSLTSVTVASPPYSATALPATDLVGNPRILRGRVDMGAIEHPGPFSLTLLASVRPNQLCETRPPVALSVAVSGGIAPYSYTWTAPAGITLSSASTPAVTATVSNALTGVQTFTITVSDAAATTSINSSLVSLTLNTPPTPTFILPPSTTLTCIQTVLTLTATSGVSYTFTGPTPGLSGVVSQNSPLGTAVVNRPGTYSVVVTGANGCTATASTVISQSLTPTTRLYVAASQTAVDGGDGLSWATAFKDLQRALNSICLQPPAEIWVAAGVYKPTGGNDRTISFTMRNGVTIYGGFVGNEQNLSDRPRIDPVGGQPSSSLLSGDLLGNDGANFTNINDNSYHVISNLASLSLNNTAVLDGFVVAGGYANGGGVNNYGGGVYNGGSGAGNSCSPNFRNCTFGSNRADYGAAMFNDGTNGGNSSPQVTNCLFQTNRSNISGGAVFNDGNGNNANGGVSSPVLMNCAFQSNLAGALGGAIFNQGIRTGNSSPQLINCSFLNNVSLQQRGGAMYNDGFNGASRPVVTNSIFWGNRGNETLFNNTNGASTTTTHCLFEPTVTGYSSDPTNLTTATSPFASTASVALANCSPAINAGVPGSVTAASGPYSATALPGTDLAGNTRIFSTGSSGGRVDMGAVEFQGDATPLSFSLLGSGTATCASVPTLTLTGSETGVLYQLQRDGVDAGTAVAGTGSGLSFGPQSLSGTYAVLATRTSSSCSLVMATSATVVSLSGAVGFSPTVSLPADRSVVCAGGSVQVVATVSGSLTGLQWYKDGQIVTGQTSATLSLGGVQAEQAGQYVLVLTGACSTSSAPFTLTVNPLPPVSLNILNNGTVLQVTQGVLYERVIVIDRINGYEIRQVDSTTNGFFTITRVGPYRIIVTGASGCQTMVESSIASLPR